MGSGVALAVAAIALGIVVPAHGSPVARPRPADPASAAARRLHDDADGALRVQRAGGRMTFVGAPHGTDVTNPAVQASQSPVTAARAHLARYGAALGADGAGTSLVAPHVAHAIDGTDVVRWQQRVDGVPVVDGQAAVALRPDRSLSSMQSDLSLADSVPAATITENDARQAARARISGRTAVVAEGRWILDPEVLGLTSSLGPRGVWRFIVGDAAGRTDVMVDDTTGRLLLGIPLEEPVNRVVCDRANALYSPSAPDPLCESGYARVEDQPATGNSDVDSAYDLAGATSDLYASLDIDLTALIGRVATGDATGTKRIESTVRFCYSGSGFACPYDNAFWDGSGMYYGQSWATADDVVGHEMTHGFTEKTSNLTYWGQPGAINESISDIMGEIVDHRYGPADEDNNAWLLGEDSPIGALRSMKDPTLYNQPDSMTSALWSSAASDSGGVHTDSGVGNKTFYLISQGTSGEQGGSFNGQSFGGIDAGDATLAKSARLWAAVDEHLMSGSDYADLGIVLDQVCSDLVGADGFTSSDCAEVHQAGLATRLATERPGVPAPATKSCPTGVPRVLFDSSTSSPDHGLSGSQPWHDPAYPDASSPELDHWMATDLPTTSVSTLSTASPIALPAGQSAYLMFRHKFLLDFEYYNGSAYYYDGGTVAVDNVDDATSPLPITSGWVNGPARTLQAPYSSYKAFSGDSIGWWTSKADLSAYAGQRIEPKFTLRTDASYGLAGWELDDVVIYTCDVAPLNTSRPSISGVAQVGEELTASPGSWTLDPSYTYQWLRDGNAIAGASASTYGLVAADQGRAITVRVTAHSPGLADGTADSPATGLVDAGRLDSVAPPVISGVTTFGHVLTASTGQWSADATYHYQWMRNGTAIPGATTATYLLAAADCLKRVSVRVSATADGYMEGSADSEDTSVISLASLSTAPPKITGIARVGKTLAVQPGVWLPRGVTFSYHWFRDGKSMKDALRTYRLTRADRGHRIVAKVTGRLSGYRSVVRSTNITAKVR